MRMFRYISLLLFPFLLLCACDKDQPGVVETEETEVTEVFPFSVTVQPESESRATFSGSDMGSGAYLFAEGDKLYISGGGGNVSGELTLVSGAGTGTATFGGELSVTGGFQPTAETELTATLVGSRQSSGFFTISDGKIVSGPDYPTSISYSTLGDLVEKYSHFTATFNYGIRRFTLTQQTVFLDFDVELYSRSLTGSPSTVQVDIKSSGGTTILSVTDVPVGGNTLVARMECIAALPASSDLQGAQTWVNNGSGIYCEPDFANDLTLSANKYYSVNRSAIDPFTVEAPSGGTGAEVTFNYTPVQYREYKGGAWSDWKNYTTKISLSAGEKVSFRGQNTTYANTTNKALIIVDNNVYIYGEMMSLICDEDYVCSATAGYRAFYRAFKGRGNINIHPDKDLLLSAATLGISCYEEMFMNCSGLTKSPVLPAAAIPARAYYSMFEGCTTLETPPALPATSLGATSYSRMFFGCSALGSIPSFPSDPVSWQGDSTCYMMFQSCSSIDTIATPLFSGTLTLRKGCFQDMFAHCTSLANIPDGLLPATTLAVDCYRGMFQYTGLTRAPFLLVETLSWSNCYRYMFYGCTKLAYIKCLASNPGTTYTQNFTGGNVGTGASGTKTFVKKAGVSWPSGADGIPTGWTVDEE